MPSATSDVSVVIPVFNGEGFVADAIASVLDQTLPPAQVIVVDDGSVDGTSGVLESFGGSIEVVAQPNLGVARARNAGVDRATGHWVAFLDADDLWREDKLEAQLDLLGETGAKVVCSGIEVVDVSLRPLEVDAAQIERAIGLRDLLQRGNLVGSPSSVVCERSTLEAVGGFAPELSFAADWDLWTRLARIDPIVRIPLPLVRYRIHPDNMSRDAELIASDSERMFDRLASDQTYPDWVRRNIGHFRARQDLVVAGCFAQSRRPFKSAKHVLRALRGDPAQSMGSLTTRSWRRVRGRHPDGVWDR